MRPRIGSMQGSATLVRRRIACVPNPAFPLAALEIAGRGDAAGATIVVLLADAAERYVTSALFST